MRSGQYKFSSPKNEGDSDINQYYLESTVGGVFDMLYHIKPLTEVLLKADPLEVIGSENDRKAFYELKVILATLDLSSSAAKVAATATPAPPVVGASPSSVKNTAMYPFDMIPFLKALGECNGIDYLHSKQQQIPFLSFWDDVIRLILVVIPPLREVFLGLFASAHQVPGWLNLVSESQRCFHIDLPSAPSSSSVKKDSVPASSETEVPVVYSLEEIFKNCLSSSSDKMEVDIDDNVDNAEKLIQMNAMILKRAPTVLAISVTSPMSYSINTNNTSTTSSSSSSSSSSSRNAVSLKIPLHFDLSDCGFHECVDNTNNNTNNSRVELLDEDGEAPTPETKTKVDVNYILCGVSLVNQHQYSLQSAEVPDEIVKCPDYMFRLIEDNANSDPAREGHDDNAQSVSEWQQVCVDYAKNEGDVGYVPGSCGRPTPIAVSSMSTVLSSTNCTPPRFLVYVRKDLFVVLDRISHLVSKAGQMRALGDVAFALAMNNLNYNEARRCYEEAIILDPSLKPELQDNFNALEKIEKTHKARLLEEQADLALANRRFREASDLYSRAMMSAVVGSGVYLWAREKFEYVTRIISLECACQYAEKGADALVVGNFLSAKEYFALAYKFNPELIHLQSIMVGLERALHNHNANQKLTDATSALKGKKFSLARTLMVEAIGVYPEKLSHYRNAVPALQPFIHIEEATKIHKQAQQLTADKKFADSIELYSKAIKLVPLKEDIEEISEQLRDNATKSSSFEICYQTSWSDLLSELLGNRAYCYFELKQYPEAIENCERALAIKPDSALAHFGLGNINFALEKYDDSAFCYKRALECDSGLAASVKVKTKQLATAKEVQLRKEREIQKAKEKEELRILVEERKLKDDIARKEKQEKQEKEKKAKLEREQKKMEERALKAKVDSEAVKEKQNEKERLRKEKLVKDAEKLAERERVKAEKEKERERVRQEKERKLQEKLQSEADEREKQRVAAENIQKAEARKREIEREKEAEKEKARLEMERTIADRERQRQERLAKQGEKGKSKLEKKQPTHDENTKNKQPVSGTNMTPNTTPLKAAPIPHSIGVGGTPIAMGSGSGSSVFHNLTPVESPAIVRPTHTPVDFPLPSVSNANANITNIISMDDDNHHSGLRMSMLPSELLSESSVLNSNVSSSNSNVNGMSHTLDNYSSNQNQNSNLDRALDGLGLLKPAVPTPRSNPSPVPVSNTMSEEMATSDVSSLSYPSLDLSAPVFVPGMMNKSTTAPGGIGNGSSISRSSSGISMPSVASGSTVTPNPTASKANLREDIIRNIHQGVSISSTMHGNNIHNINNAFQAPSQAVTCEQCREVCDGVNRIISYGACNHFSYCSVCIYSRRSLLNNMTCPVCSQRCDSMICTPKPTAAYTTLALPHNVNALLNSHNSTTAHSGTVVISDNICFDKKSRLFFPKEYYQSKILYLSIYTCPVCNYQDMNPDAFQIHLYSLHGLGLCHNCVMHKAIFPAYHMAYTMESLRVHMNECLNATNSSSEDVEYKSGVYCSDERNAYMGHNPSATKQRGANGYGLKKMGMNVNSAAFDSTSAKFEEEFPSLGGSGPGGRGADAGMEGPVNGIGLNMNSNLLNAAVGAMNNMEYNDPSHIQSNKKSSSTLETEPSLLATMLGQSYSNNPCAIPNSSTPPPLPLPLHEYNTGNMSNNGSKLLSTLGFSHSNMNNQFSASSSLPPPVPSDNVSSIFSDLLLSDKRDVTDGLDSSLYGNQNQMQVQSNFDSSFLSSNIGNSHSHLSMSVNGSGTGSGLSDNTGYGQPVHRNVQASHNMNSSINGNGGNRDDGGIFDLLQGGNETGSIGSGGSGGVGSNHESNLFSFLNNGNLSGNLNSLDNLNNSGSLNGLLSGVNVGASGSSDLLGGSLNSFSSDVVGVGAAGNGNSNGNGTTTTTNLNNLNNGYLSDSLGMSLGFNESNSNSNSSNINNSNSNEFNYLSSNNSLNANANTFNK